MKEARIEADRLVGERDQVAMEEGEVAMEQEDVAREEDQVAKEAEDDEEVGKVQQVFECSCLKIIFC